MDTRREYALSLTMSLIWLFFLFIPLRLIAIGPYSPALRSLGYLLIAIFAIVNVTTWVLTFLPRLAHRRTELFVSSVIIQSAITASVLWLFGAAGLSLFPYLFSLVGIHLPLAAASTVVVVLGASMEIAGWWLNTSALAHQLLFISIAIFAMTAGSRYFDQIAKEKQAAIVHETTANERSRLARDIHDVLGHSLTVMSMKSELALRLFDVDPSRARAEIEDIRDLSRAAIAEVRATVSGIRMRLLDEELTSAVEVLRKAGLQVTVTGSVDDVDPRFRFVFAWVVREASTNILRHSRASQITITLSSSQISVSDDGVGIGATAPGNGLTGLSERITAAGGRLEISDNSPGTIVRATMI